MAKKAALSDEKTAVIYTRVSTADQADVADSHKIVLKGHPDSRTR